MYHSAARGSTSGMHHARRGSGSGSGGVGAGAGTPLYKPLLSYFLREGLYGHAYDEAHRQVQQRGGDTHLLLWRAFAAGMEGGIPEAVRELEALRVKRDAEFACIHALIVFHKRSSAVDSEVIESLAAAAPIAESMTSHAGLLLAARVLWHCGNFEESLRLIDGVLGPATVGPLQDEALLLKGWVELGLNPLSSEAARDLDRCNLVSDIDLAMARARCASARPNRRDMKSSAFEHLGQAIALAPTFWPALTEKALLLAEVGDWEQAMEVLERVFEMEGQADNLQALRIQSLEAFVRGDGAPNSVSLVEQLSESLRIHEGRNAHLHWLVSQPLSRVCGRQREILTRTLAMAERACELTHLPDQASVYLLELGLQRQRLGAHKSAMDAYLQAGQAEGGTVGAILGQVRCLIEEGALEDAEQQLEFLSVVQGDESLASSTGLPFLRALLRWRRDGDAAEHVSLLDESRAMHAAARQSASSLKSRSLYKVLTMADPDFMLELANEYLLHCDPSSKGKGRGSMNVAVQRGMSLLEATVALVPALLSARLLMAKVHLAMGQEDAASRVLDHCLELSPTFSEGHLLRAQIELGRGNADAAEASLELALSHNFKVRSSPLFHLIRARLLVRSGKLDEAATNLEDALRLPGVRDGAGSGESSPLGLSAHLADIFVEMIGVYSSLGRHAEAQELVAEAQARFRGQPSEVRMLIASSELALRKGELDRAVSILTAVPKNSPVYAEAQMARADIYLSHRHDKRAFAQCHRDLVRQDPTADGFMRLGDAYLRIQMPESAVEAYEGALDMNPTDPHIRSKIGRALIATHDYRRALEYHKKALRSAPGNLGLRLDLARLYLKLRRYEDAVMLLSQSIGDAGAEKGRRVDSVEAMKADIDILCLLAEVHTAAGDLGEASHCLSRAHDMQRTVVDRSRGSTGGSVLPLELSRSAAICRQAAFCSINDEGSQQWFSEALASDEADEGALAGLARLCLKKRDLEGCKKYAAALLRVNEGSEEGTMLLGEAMFLESETDGATKLYSKLLTERPNNYAALAKLLDLLRLAGRSADGWSFIAKASTENPRSSNHAGLHYCKGLHYRFTNDAEEATKHFNLARRDGEWGVKSLERLVEIYINPEQDCLWVSAPPPPTENVRTAEKLLFELKDIMGESLPSLRVRVLENYILLASRTKENIDLAMSNFISMLEEEKDYLPALLGMSTAFMLEQAPNKARNALKRIAKMPYTTDMADEFEQSYLLLADLYVERGKFDLAQDLCKRCLSYNKSCSKAWETIGMVMEKEQSYRDAADCYERSWTLENEASAVVGFKLAFNYLKAEKHVPAIEVCNKVLLKHPNYPKIKDEILSRAYASLRP